MDSSYLCLFRPSRPTYSLDLFSPYDFKPHPLYLIPYRPLTHLLGNDSTPHDSFLVKRLFDVSTQLLDFFGTSPRKKKFHDLTHKLPPSQYDPRLSSISHSTFFTRSTTHVTRDPILVYRPLISFTRPTTHVIRPSVKRLMTLLPTTSGPPRLTIPF